MSEKGLEGERLKVKKKARAVKLPELSIALEGFAKAQMQTQRQTGEPILEMQSIMLKSNR